MESMKLYIDPVTGCVTPFNPKIKGDGETGSTKGGK